MHSTLTIRRFTPPPVSALGEEARIQIKAARMWVVLARHHRNPRPVLSSLLGSASPRFCLLMEHVAAAWPDPFTSHPPCACAVTPDESTLLALLDFAARDRRDSADALLADMLAPSERARLWTAAVRVAEPGWPT